MHQIISIHVGQCGIQIGSAVWELLTSEHSLASNGILYADLNSSDEAFESFFNKCGNGNQYVPRVLFVDLEPNVIDEIKTGSYRHLFHPDQLINGNEDAANNFARGFYTSGRIIKNACQKRLRKEIELTDNLHAIHIYRSLGGGTGSGMTATILESLSEVSKITKVEIPIHPSPYLCTAIVEPYNCILTEHYCMDDIDLTLLMDNEALYDVVSDELSINHPTMIHMNRIIAQICSSITSSSRFHNDLSNDFTIITNLVPYPRIHYPLVSYAPLGNSSKMEKNINSVLEITRSVFQPSNQLVKCNTASGKYMSCSLLYRGSMSPTEVHEALCEIKCNKSVKFVDWCPTGFKVGIVNQQPHILPQSQVGMTSKNVIMMTNNSSVSIVWHLLSQKFHTLYAKRSFVHWFVSEGLEESEFCESLYNLVTLAKDYEEVSLDTKIVNNFTEDISKASNNDIVIPNKKISTNIEATSDYVLTSSPGTKKSRMIDITVDKIVKNATSLEKKSDDGEFYNEMEVEEEYLYDLEEATSKASYDDIPKPNGEKSNFIDVTNSEETYHKPETNSKASYIFEETGSTKSYSKPEINSTKSLKKVKEILIKLHDEHEGQDIVEDIVIKRDITETTEEKYVKEENPSETEIKFVTHNDTPSNSDSPFVNINSFIIDENNGQQKARYYEVKQLYKEMENLEIQNYMHNHFDHENGNNSNSRLSSYTKLKTNRDVQHLIRALSCNVHEKQLQNTTDLDTFSERFSSNDHKSGAETSVLSKPFIVKNEFCSRLVMLNTKSKLNRRCHASMENFGNEEEDIQTLMEELIRITTQVII